MKFGSSVAGVAAGVLALAQAQQSAAQMAIDGSAGDWSNALRVHPPFNQISEDSNGKLFGTFDGADDYFFYVEPPTDSLMINAHVYFNLDHERSTGYTGPASYGFPAGMDVYALVTLDFNVDPLVLSVNVYSGCTLGDLSCATLLLTLTPDVDYAKTAATQGVEFKISKSALEAALGGGTTVGDFDIALLMASRNVQGAWAFEYGPENYLNWYPFYADMSTLAECASGGEERGAVLFSQTVSDNFFDAKSYRQLFMSMQYQLMQMGLPHDRVELDDVLDVASACQYKVIVIPYMAHVDVSMYWEVRKALFQLIHFYGVGIVTTGDFMTNGADGAVLPGDPYFQMKMLFGLANDAPVFAQTSQTLVEVSSTGNIFSDKAQGELLMDSSFAGTFANMYVGAPSTSFEVSEEASQTITVLSTGADETYSCVQTTELVANIFERTSGRIVHFSTMEVLANQDLAWRGVQHVLLGGKPASVGLQLSRFESLFVGRNDVDQSQYFEEATILEPAVFEMVLKPWYDLYGFAMTHFINVGNDPADGSDTDWDWARTTYGAYLGIEQEMGSHSYTHPHDINQPGVDLEFEFNQAQLKITQELGLTRLGTAQPGATETLATAKTLEQWLAPTYFSGGYSGVGAGYPGAFGFLDPESTMVYMAPNMFFDFTMIEFLGWAPEVSKQFWLQQYANQSRNSRMPIFHYPVHDYALVDWNDADYENPAQRFNKGLYPADLIEPIIANAFNEGTEFVPCMQLADRIRAFDGASLEVVETSASVLTATVTSNGGDLGTMSLMPFADNATKIVSVGAWYAFSDTKVFLPSSGGTFVVTHGGLSEPTEDVTRIVDLGMRNELVSVQGDGVEISFTFTGVQSVVVYISNNASNSISLSGVSSASISGRRLKCNFVQFATHTIVISTNRRRVLETVPTIVAPDAESSNNNNNNLR